MHYSLKFQNGSLKPLTQYYILDLLLEYKNENANPSWQKKSFTKNSGILKVEIAKAFANHCNDVS